MSSMGDNTNTTAESPNVDPSYSLEPSETPTVNEATDITPQPLASKLASKMQLPAFDPTDTVAGLMILEEMTSCAAHIQEQVLEEILIKNKDTEYLKRFLDGQSDKELFKKKIPVVDYEDIMPFIERIAVGEPSELICSEPITELIQSSGTSGGKQKWIPTTGEKQNRHAFFFNIAVTVLNPYLQGLKEGKTMHFLFLGPSINTSGGLVVRSALTSEFNSRISRQTSSNESIFFTTPNEVILCQDAKQSMYCQILCGLVQRDEVVRIGTTFASIFIRVIKFLEENWQELCSNIRTGQISEWITDLNCRTGVSCILNRQMPDLADSIELECKGKSWGGIIKKLWPRAKFIEPLRCLVHSYTIHGCYEFLPVEDVNLKSEIVDLANVKIGQHYELLVTNFTGRDRAGRVPANSEKYDLHSYPLFFCPVIFSQIEYPLFLGETEWASFRIEW